MAIFGAAVGCTASLGAGNNQHRLKTATDSINGIRTEDKTGNLSADPLLFETARARATTLAADLTIPPPNEDHPLERLVKAGCFARFALSHAVVADNTDEAIEQLLKDPLGMGRISHRGVTHIGMGTAHSGKKTVLVVDLARLVEPIDRDSLDARILDDMQQKRTIIGVEPVQPNEKLSSVAQTLVDDFMSQKANSPALIARAKEALADKAFSLGQVTIAFQVAGSWQDIVVPERTSDPALRYVGWGIAQGNHPDHEPGSIALALLLARPQGAVEEHSRSLSNIPPPRAVKTSNTRSGPGSLRDQAWIATLTGNHQRAASLFEAAYQKFQKPDLMYESARAHARNGDLPRALKAMREYASMVEGTSKEQAQEMVQKLENGESIFADSAEAKMSVEAKRFFIMGQNLFAAEEWAGAIDAFSQAYAYAPHPDLLYNIGLAHLRNGNVGDALDFFAEYQKLVPEANNVDEARQLFEIGTELYRIGQFEAAARRFTMAYVHLPIPELIFNLALCHKAMGQTSQALQRLRELLDISTDEAELKEIRELIDELSAQ